MSRRKGLIAAALVGGIAAVSVHLPAQAAGPYKILAAPVGVPTLATAFGLSGCDAAILSSPANGADARIVPVTNFAGTKVRVAWTHAASSAATFTRPMGISSAFGFWNAACATSSAVGARPANAGYYDVNVPSGAKWMVVTGSSAVDISFTVNPAP